MTVQLEKSNKPNHFNVYDKIENKIKEVKYLDQKELADGWQQVIPNYKNEKLFNYFNVTLAFLPEKLWPQLKKYKVIKDGMTRYTIIETNQDEIMKNLFNEIKKYKYNTDVINNCINNLNASQYSSWLVIKANKLLNN